MGINWAKVGVAGPAPGVGITPVAPGASGLSLPGTRIPGTTGMFSGAQQNLGYGVGQGGVTLSGTRGTNVVGYDPSAGKLAVNWNFLDNKPRIWMGLWDVTAQQWASTDMEGQQTAGTQGQSGWMSFPYISGSSGTTNLTGVSPIDPTHIYTLQVALPMEGGVGSDVNDPGSHPQFSGAQILGLANASAVLGPNPTQIGPPSSSASAPASTSAAPLSRPVAGGISAGGGFSLSGQIFGMPTPLVIGGAVLLVLMMRR
jgi:hypothetical protein